MNKKTIPIGFVIAALCGTAAIAQETQSDTGASQVESSSELDLGESGPRIGEQYVKEESGAWNVTCLKTENEQDPCLLRQILLGEEGQPVAEISINRLPEGGNAVAAASLVVPLETLLQAQVALSIDGAPGKRYNYHHCNPVGCVAQLGFTQGDIDAMKGGEKATVSLVSVLAPTQLLQVEMSLAGFTSGYEKIQVLQN